MYLKSVSICFVQLLPLPKSIKLRYKNEIKPQNATIIVALQKYLR